VSDERWTPEERALQEAARAKPKPVRADPPPVPCRKYVDNPVTPAEIERFAEELKEK
jgi:hypothetical protein